MEGRFGRQERHGWLNMADRAKQDLIPRLIGSCFLIALVVTYRTLFKLYDKGDKEYEELLRLSPRG